MKGSGHLSSKHQSPRTESFTGENTKKTKKIMMSKNLKPISKRQTYSENMLQDGNQDHSTDSYQERPSIFTEIWPSSESSSPSDTPTSDKNVQLLSTIKSSDLGTSQSSVLARYVDRFRHGQPQSREERQQKACNDKEEQLPFWWTSSTSLPPILTPEESDLRLPCHNLSLNPCRRSTNMSDTSQYECESEILQLQERASRLLQKGEFCLEEESIPVSSDGVGCSDFSSPVNADEPVRRPMISSSSKSSPLVVPSLFAPIRPEEDILFQWRLRRKMEKAREWTKTQNLNPQDLHAAHPVMTLQTIHPPDFPHGTKHQQTMEPHLTNLDQQTQATTPATTRTTRVDASGSLGSPPQALAHVPSHMHLLCDILPCPNQHSHSCEGSVSQKLDSNVVILPQTTINSITKCMSPPKTPITGSAERDVHLSDTKTIEGPKKQTEKSEKNASVVSKQHKKSAGVHSRHKISLQQKRKYIEGSKKSRADGAPLPSPIHSTLGQVVSEALFPSSDSTIVRERTPATPSCSVSAPKQSDSHISREVISQLLQEAEDSDEKEFEDDPLLQVLRKQRKWIKEQINEMDILLKEFPEQHKV